MRGMRKAVLLMVLASICIGTTSIQSQAGTPGFGEAGVVVVHGDGSVVTRCVALDRAQMSGFKLLTQSGLAFKKAQFDFGKAICRLDHEGPQTTKPSKCFSDPDMNFWGYWVQNSGETSPTSSDVGAQDRVITQGAVDYWVWDTYPQTAPTPTTLATICS